MIYDVLRVACDLSKGIEFMIDEVPETINQAKITVTFYSGPNESDVKDKLSKTYVLKNWSDETDLRRLLDEIAEEMHHLSGYGIWVIEVNSTGLKFIVDYKTRFKPYLYESVYHDFWDVLRFDVGYYVKGNGQGSKVRIEIPRIGITIPYNAPLKKFEPDDLLFQIRADSVGGKRDRSRVGTRYRLSFDVDNPYLVSFLRKISKEGVLLPDTTRKWEYTTFGPYSLSWWKLLESQTTLGKRRSKWKQEEKKKKEEERKQKQLEKAGIVYKPKKKKEKAYQVYIIGAEDGNLADIYKIGISNAPGKRLQSLNTSNPFKLAIIHKFVAEPAKEAETQLHARFQASRTSGEWFRLTPEQISELKRIIEFRDGSFIKS